MKKFIIKFVVFILPFILAGISIELILREIPNDYVLKKQFLDKYSSKLKILILGNSHSFYGVDPQFFIRNTFNVAHESQSLEFDAYIYNKYKNRMKNLEYVLISVSYFSLFSRLEESIEQWRIKNYTLYWNYPSHSLKYKFEILNNQFSLLVKRPIRYLIGNGNNITCSQLGFGLSYSYVKQMNLERTGKISASHHLIAQPFINFPENIKLLEEIINDCNLKHIKVFLITFPAWKTYRENLNTQQLNRMKNECEMLTTKFPNVKYFSFLSDNRFSRKDFYNADHLNELGSKKMSKILNRIIEEIGNKN